MEPQFRTSFIPKKTLTAGAALEKVKGNSLGIISLIALIIALGAVVLSVGIFLYQQILTSSIARKAETLERARAAFEPALIQELVRLDARIQSAGVILNEHLAPSTLFSILEDSTLKSVRFSNFSLNRVGDNKIGISMQGVANNFNGVALQADIFGKSKAIKEPIFSNLNLDQTGKAVFTVTAFVDPAFINFINQEASPLVASSTPNI